jgi:ribosomal protein S18 acetylase RimI-like enzyme
MLDRDIDRVAEIDRGTFAVPWHEEAWMRARTENRNVGMVIEVGEQVVGCCLYELHPDHIKLQRLAVSPSFQRKGLGFAAVKKLFDKLSFERRTHVLTTVPQDDLQVQKFFRACGFRAVPDTASPKGGASRGHYLFRADLTEIRELRGAGAR